MGRKPLLRDSIAEKEYDVRLIDKHLNTGVISLSDVEKNASSLPDDAENASYRGLDDLSDMDDVIADNVGKARPV